MAVNWKDVRTRLMALCDAIEDVSVVDVVACDTVTLPFVRVTRPSRSTKRVVSAGQGYHIARQFNIFLYVQEDCDPAKPEQYESALDAAAELLDVISDALYGNPTLRLAGSPDVGAKIQNEMTDSGVQTDTYNGKQYSIVVTSLTVEAIRSTNQ